MSPNMVRCACRVPGALLVAAAVSGLLAPPTLAAEGNSVHVHVASTVQSGVSYPVKLDGQAAQKSTLYVFLDNRGCLKSPAAEHARGAEGYVWDLATGAFSRKAMGKTSFHGKDHACAYLVKGTHYHPGSPPGNPRHGVVAHSFATFTVQ